MPIRKRRLEILFGPIASGKSTYARERAKAGALVANDDSIVLAVHGGEYGAYCETLKPLYKSIRHQIISAAASADLDVIVDSTGLKRSTRDFLRLLGRQLDFDVYLTIFRKGLFGGKVDGIRRFKADPRGMTKDEWVRIADHHATIVDYPDDFERSLYKAIKTICWKRSNV